MIFTPPFYLSGEAGKALGEGFQSLAALGVQAADLFLRSLDADELTFVIRDKGTNTIPDDEQWITLRDDAGVVHFSGIARRSYTFSTRTYSYRAANFYKGLLETPLTDGDRPFVLYGSGDLGDLVRDILGRASTAGLALQPPATLPEFFLVPKMAFRAASCGGAMEDALKWAPDTATRADYSTTPPTLRFFCRSQSEPSSLDLDQHGHAGSELQLTPVPEARALAVSFAYARRDGDNIVNYLVQTAGDDAAAASRKISLYLSGQERSDMLVTEALTTAQKAVAMAQASVDAVGASIDAAAASAQIAITWSALVTRDANLTAAVAAQPGFSMSPSLGATYVLYTASSWSGSPPVTSTNSMPTAALALRTSGGALATGWYPIETGAFTAPELITAGATKETRYIRGDFFASRLIGASNTGMNSLETGAPGDTDSMTGWIDGYGGNADGSDADYRKYLRYGMDLAVDAIDMAPTAVAAAVTAAAAAGSSAMITRAEFVEAPPDLAQNYFARQDWTPYKGQLTLTPSASMRPAPGDFLNVIGEGVPADWNTMKAPVAELSIDLRTLASTVTIGPSPRMDFSSLVDRLRIPVEDNYEPG